MDHATLLRLLLAADPAQAACGFRTTFADGEIGETGTLRYLATDRWILDVDHGGRTVSTPHGSWYVGRDGELRKSVPTTPSFGSAVALLLPRYRGIEGAPGDDWTLDPSVPVTDSTTDGRIRAVFRHTEHPTYQAEATIHPTLHSILTLRTPAWVAELVNLRTDLTESELGEMESLFNQM
ncbi:hypothetical protein [Streptomyces sp. NPDC096339]|uniref:hypothetical protein n=1 Tax=Streptomyces sp. NPDC096339 TaxID=3366086 RepID=UPI00381E7546